MPELRKELNCLKTPSNTQRQAIEHLSGPAQVIAGPGSGKTYTIIQRILYLIKHHHIPPENILVITYTKAAANEMKERYEEACGLNIAHAGKDSIVAGSDVTSADKTTDRIYMGNAASGSVVFGTFHGVCYHILRRSGSFRCTSLIKETDKRKLLEVLARGRNLSGQCDYDKITRLQNSISRMKNLGNAAEDISEEFSYEDLIYIKEEYDKYLRDQNLLDFDDMITECLKLLTANPAFRRRYQQTFSYILVDEFQDINFPQYQILKFLAAPTNNLLVVGDDDQSIYGFRGASPGIMKRFMTDFPKGRQIFLTDNYRSGSQIVVLAGKMIAQNKQRYQKEFYPVRTGGKVSALCFDTRKQEEMRLISELSSPEPSCGIVSKTEQLEGTAIILRTNLEVVQYRELLRESGIPVKGKGIRDCDLFHGFVMDDISAFLSYLFEGNKRCDFIKFMNKPNRFISRSALVCEKVGLEQLERYYAQNTEMRSQLRLFFGQLKIAEGLSPHLAISLFRKTLGYEAYIRQKAGDYRTYKRWAAQTGQIQEYFKEYKVDGRAGSVKNFITRLAEKAGEGTARTVDESGVSVLTMHGSKGLEFERVFLPDVNDGIIPGKECQTVEALEEERRLLYVAMTRAKDELFLYYTKERGRKLSRFLTGLIS